MQSLQEHEQNPSSTKQGVILFAVTEFLGTSSQVPLLLVIDAFEKLDR
jgi:hypothetical protein